MLPQIAMMGAQAGMGLYGAYRASKEKAASAERMNAAQNRMNTRDTIHQNKMMSKYDQDSMDRNILMSGDFSKSPLYAGMQSRIGRESSIAKQNAADDIAKRGLGGTGLGSMINSQIDNNSLSSMTQAMGNVATSINPDPNLINSAYNMNQGLNTEYNAANADYQGINPSLGGISSALTDASELYSAYEDKKQQEKFIDSMLSKYSAKTNPKVTGTGLLGLDNYVEMR